MDEATQPPFNAELRLRSLATDILEHEACEGCRVNAAEALERLGTLEEIRQRLRIEDPREAQRRRWEEHRERAVAGRPPRVTLSLEAEVVMHEPSEELQDRLSSAVTEAVEKAVRELPGASLVGFTMAVTDA